MLSRPRALAVASALGLLLLLAGCTGGPEPVPGAAETSTPAAAPTAAASSAEAPTDAPAVSGGSSAAVVDCDAVAEVAGPITSGLQLSADDSSEDSSGTTCVWITGGVSAATTDLDAYGSLGITVDGTGWSPEDLDAVGRTGLVLEDPRAEAVGGTVLLGAQGETLADVGSLQLLLPDSTVTIVTTGALLGAGAPEFAIPVDPAIGVAVDVAALRG